MECLGLFDISLHMDGFILMIEPWCWITHPLAHLLRHVAYYLDIFLKYQGSPLTPWINWFLAHESMALLVFLTLHTWNMTICTYLGVVTPWRPHHVLFYAYLDEHTTLRSYTCQLNDVLLGLCTLCIASLMGRLAWTARVLLWRGRWHIVWASSWQSNLSWGDLGCRWILYTKNNRNKSKNRLC